MPAAVTVYATTTQLGYFTPPAILAGVSSDAQNAALEARSRWADSFLNDQWTLPLVSPIPSDLAMYVCFAAGYDLAVRRGYNPEAGGDPNIRLRYEDAEKWMYAVASKKITPMLVDSSSGAQPGVTDSGAPSVTTADQRGYSTRPTPAYQNPQENPGDFQSN